jgi:V8-like Glu-specific endopeptidase
MATLLDEILTDQEVEYGEYDDELALDDEFEAPGRVGRRRRRAGLGIVPPRARAEEYEEEELSDLEIIPPTDSRKRITDTKRIPFRWICTIIPTFRHPNTGKPIEMTDQPGSGVVIGPMHILTAAHVLFPTDPPLQDQSPIQVKVTPGHDDTSEPYGHYVSSTYRVRSEWRSGGKNTHNPSYDFAIIKISTDLRKKGVKCWGEAGTDTYRYPIGKSWLKGKVVNVGGSPRDRKLYTQWLAYDKLDDPEPTRNGTKVKNVFTHKVDTCTGQSGAPVWYWDGKSKRYLVGIHTGSCPSGFLDGCTAVSGAGCVSGSSRGSHNRGVLLTPEVDAQIKAWLK